MVECVVCMYVVECVVRMWWRVECVIVCGGVCNTYVMEGGVCNRMWWSVYYVCVIRM